MLRQSWATLSAYCQIAVGMRAKRGRHGGPTRPPRLPRQLFHRFHLGSAVAGAGAGTVGVQATWQSCVVSLLPRSYLREGGLRDGLSPRREDAGNRLSGAGSKRLDLCGRCQEACHRVGDAVSTRRCGCEGDYAFLCPSTRTCAGPGRAGLECFQGPASATRRSQTLARTPPRR
jgi:hypothetical protein